jgi:ATPase subunit of ABC transporter with duplicated ATPase domains
VERKRGRIRRVKHWETALAILASASIALAGDFKTISGKEYKNVTVSRVEADGIVLKSKSGISKVYFSELPKEVQERFHYDPAQARQFNAAQQDTVTQQNAAMAEQQQQQEELRRAEEIKKNMRTVREVESDQPRFLDQPFLLKGTIEIANYYNFGYDRAEQTHYSFTINDEHSFVVTSPHRGRLGKNVNALLF